MRRFQLGLIAMLICCVAFISCGSIQEWWSPDEPTEITSMDEENITDPTGMVDPAGTADPTNMADSEDMTIPEDIAPPRGMVLIPAGEFQMGSDDDDAYADEQPVHTVYVDAFFMDVYEVTNAQYKEFVEANPEWQKDKIDPRFNERGDYLAHWSENNPPAGKANHPVIYVNWYAAMAYAQWAGKRLPTEAEWEYAARGKRNGAKYPWGDTISSENANYNSEDTKDVGSYPPNDFGLYDVTGNVYEWCLDAYDANYYENSPSRNPISGIPINELRDNFENVPDTDRVLRGGSLYSPAEFAHVAIRNRYPPAESPFDGGFRCVRDITP